MAFTGDIILEKIYFLSLCFAWYKYKTWAINPTSLYLGTGTPYCKDHETTSPRIYVNRRTPSCTINEVTSFKYTRQKRVASYFQKEYCGCTYARAVRKATPLRNNFLGAKVRNNSELFGIYKKNVLFCSYIYTSMPFSMNTCISLVIRI